MTHASNIKQVIKREYIQCARDPIYFLKKYCIIQHPQRGKIKFELYDFQESVLKDFQNSNYNIILKSRQLGISTLMAGYSLWLLLFHNDKNILVIATSKDTAKNLVTKVRVMFQGLPSWLKAKQEEDNKLSMRLTNGSQIKAIASSESAGRSEALSLLMIDEAAFIDNISEIWTAAQQTLATGGDCIVASTPNGIGGWFHKTWQNAIDGNNNFSFVELPWYLHPEREQAWRDEQDIILGPTMAAQECLGGESRVVVRDLDTKVIKEISLSELYKEIYNGYEIQTPIGFKNFSGIRKLTKERYFSIALSNDKNIKCSYNHRFILDGIEIYAYELYKGCKIDSQEEDVFVNSIDIVESEIDLYDILDVDTNIFNVDGIVSHNCDASFLSSGNSVVDPLILQWYKENQIKDPVERLGVDNNLWVWDQPDYSKEYMVVADVARGDGTDYSAAHVFEIENIKQVAEYKGQLSTTDYGNFLIELATKYNDALLIIENNNVGWATIQTVIDREYKNLFYQSKDLHYVDTDHQMQTNRYRAHDRNMIPGFTTSRKSRPLIVAKMEEYTREKLVELRSARLVEELFVFIYYNSRAEAMRGYNDDLVISYAIALWIRDTALKLKTERDSMQRALMDSVLNSNTGHDIGFSKGKIKPKDSEWEIDIRGEKEDLSWLL